jgi:excisionase family DNA binding protein
MDQPVLVHSVPEACQIARTGRTSLYEAIRSGALRAVKRGRRTLILDKDLRQWLETLPQILAERSGTQI